MLSSDRWMPGNVWSPTVTAWMCISSADTAIIENGPTPSLMVRLRPLLGHPVNGVLSLLVAVVVGQRLVHSWYRRLVRSEEHTSELQSLMRISYAVFCLKKKTKQNLTNAKDAIDGKNIRERQERER